jgi:hypothetical protein
MRDEGKEPPVGELFSRVYLEKGAPTQDSMRFRRRLAGYLLDVINNHFPRAASLRTLASVLHSELGVTFLHSAYDSGWNEFFETAELCDVLDTITLIAKNISSGNQDARREWQAHVARTIREENLGYRLDPQGGVHYFADAEFERNRVATIATLGSPRYRAALASFEAAQGALDAQPLDGKAAIRDTFEAAEIVFKLRFGVARLGTSEVQKHLRPAVQKVYVGNIPALNAANQLLEALASWTNGAHQYRHGQGLEEPAQPPLAFAIAMVSTGASYIRWLAEIDAELELLG